DGKVVPEWRSLFMEFADRFMVGTDTHAPDIWRQVPERAAWMRAWLADLPPDVAEHIAWKNGEAVLRGIAAKQTVRKEQKQTMPKKARVSSPQVPEPPPQTWSNCLVVGHQVFIAGMTARTGTTVVGGDNMYEQAKAVFAKIKHLMEAAGGKMDDVVKV